MEASSPLARISGGQLRALLPQLWIFSVFSVFSVVQSFAVLCDH
jgi:hypothetical protein